MNCFELVLLIKLYFKKNIIKHHIIKKGQKDLSWDPQLVKWSKGFRNVKVESDLKVGMEKILRDK